MTADRYGWLEDVEGERALDWVRERNTESEAALADDPRFARTRDRIQQVLDSDERIPVVTKAGEFVYNFWTDAEHERGRWRRTTLDSYRTDAPAWEVLLDVDALNADEDANWVWHGARILRPDCTRALVALSRGGSDADITREFDLTTKSWVPDGFRRPESKGGCEWIDADTVFVHTDFGEGSMTSSGYPRTVRRWRRGTPMSQAPIIYAGEQDDMVVLATHDHTPGHERDLVIRNRAFYDREVFVLGSDDTLRRVDVPRSARTDTKREWLLVQPRTDWTTGGATHPAGSLLAARLEDVLAGGSEFTTLFAPTATTSLAGWCWTRSHLVLNVLDNVTNRLHVMTPPTAGPGAGDAGDAGTTGDWTPGEITSEADAEASDGIPKLATLTIDALDPDESDAVWLFTTDYLTPTTLALVEVGAVSEPIKAVPAFFDADDLRISQHFAVSADGTRVPYFQVSAENLPMDGSTPTLQWGYGGFEQALTPTYDGGLGRSWLALGGCYVVANIRGGGEFGPQWHRAALGAQRHRAYEDFAAVARDLVDRGVTTPERLGAQGRSNGGLLVGNMITGYPELFGAIVCQVPLLDMERYSHLLAGASWMAEYGDPDDPEQWESLATFSPYHLFDPDRTYPPVLLATSTRDDRVHPGHARKMAALMLTAGKDVTYYENLEGGHAGAATNEQTAHWQALAWTFLQQRLMGSPQRT